jgi:hypothetical protein
VCYLSTNSWLDELRSEKKMFDKHGHGLSNFKRLFWDNKDRLIEIVEWAEWIFLCPSGRRYCEFCGGQKPGTEPTGLANVFFGHLPTCLYSDEWEPDGQ